MKKINHIFFSLLLLTGIFATDCTNALRIGANKARSEKAIQRDIKKYDLEAAEHYSASNQYIDHYMQFIEQNIHERPSNLVNFCLIINKDGYLLKKSDILRNKESGCSDNKYNILLSIQQDSTISLSDTGLINVDSTFNLLEFVHQGQIAPIKKTDGAVLQVADYLAVIHWGVFCNNFNKLSSFYTDIIKERCLPIKPIYLNIDHKE